MSLTIGSLFALLLDGYVKKRNIDLGIGELQTWLENTILLLAPLGIWIGRVRAGGVTWLGFRTKK